MKVANFIKACSRSIYDRDCNVISAQEWIEILNFQAGELYPEITYRGTITGTITSLGTSYQLDLSGSEYDNLEQIKEIYLVDSNGFKYPYTNWVFEKDIKLLFFDPETDSSSTISLTSYTSYIVVWMGYIPEIDETQDTIDLDLPKLTVFKKICIREALKRILYDHAKLDRYRTLVTRMNEYALMGILRDLTAEIELGKRKLADSRRVISF
ncbi:hypothetical protein KAW50_02610 [candidate division WOR-3 bacterium]|nr:hypothetical protein [candidate division WOR-3 bacterium]